jgi:GDP-mannose 6-dehydrogenase
MLAGVLPSNQVHIEQAADVVLGRGRCRIGMLGLSFKSGTDDLRESPLVTMVERFIGKGLDLSIYDPEVSLSRLMGANRRYIEETIPHIASLMSDDCESVIDSADVIVVGLNDNHILDAVRRRTREGQLVLDLVNIPERDALRGEYVGICW